MVRSGAIGILIAATLLLATGLGVAQTSQGPAANSSPLLDSSGYIKQDAYMAKPLPGSESAYASINGHHIKDLLKEIVGVSLKSRDDGNKYWGRIAGTKYESMAARIAESHFREDGMVDIHELPVPLPPQWFPTDWSMTAEAAGKSLTFKTFMPAEGSAPTPASGLRLPLVWVGLGTAADFQGRDVRGKAALMQIILQPGEIGNTGTLEGAVKRAADAGVGALIMIWGYDDNLSIIGGQGGGVANVIKVPSFYVGYEDGKILRDLIGTGQPVNVDLNLKADMQSGLSGVAAFGTLPGTIDENIIVMAHTDAWFYGSLDNASGVSVMEALAEYFSKIPKEKRRRNMIFIATSGHHAGSPTTAYMHERRDTMLAKTALMINCEHVAHAVVLQWHLHYRTVNEVNGRRWWVYGSDRLTQIALNAWNTFGIALTGDMDPGASGDMGHIDHDAPSIQIIDSPELKHTDADVPELVPDSGLESVARAYAKVIDEANKLDRSELLPKSFGHQGN